MKTPAVYFRIPYAAPAMRIGLFGGSFNPPHEGHLLVADTAIRRLRLHKLWWMITPGNPLKDHHELAPLPDRIKACASLITNPKIHVTSFETGFKSPYSAATINTLQIRYPQVHFVWVMGADSLAFFHHWHHWRNIVDTIPIAVVDRPQARNAALSSPLAKIFTRYRIDQADARYLALMKPPAWIYLDGPGSSQSSTALRQKAYCKKMP